MTQQQDVSAISQRFVEVVGASGEVNSFATIKWYETRLKTFLSWMQANQRTTLDDAAFNAFALHLKQRVANKTLSKDSLPGFYRVLRRFGRWLQSEGYAPKDPARALKMPHRRTRAIPKSLSDDEIEKLMEVSQGMPREAAMVRCLRRSGARAEELLQLRWGSIDWKARPVRAIVIGKGDKERPIFFGEDAVEALQEYRKWLPEECTGDEQPVWWGKRRNHPWQPLKYTGFYLAMKRLAREAGAEHFNPHRWRHSFARSRRLKNQTLADVQDLMGHSDPETTRMYDGIPIDKLGDAFMRFLDE